MIMKKKPVNRTLYRLFVIALVAVLLVFTLRATSGEIVTEKLTDGELLELSSIYETGSVYDRHGCLLVKGSSHGSTDEEKLIWSSNDIRENFENLLGMDITKTMNSGFSLAGHAPTLFGSEDERFGLDNLLHPFKKRVGGSVAITLDPNVQQYIRDLATKKYGINGDDVYLVVSNYRTGEVRAVFNRVFEAMLSPGSTMKSIAAVAALSMDPELINYTYDCNDNNHVFKVNGKTFKVRCANGVNHGTVTMKEALACSCNGYFINLLLNKLDKNQFMSELKKCGLNTTVHFEQFTFWDGVFAQIDKENPDTVDEAYLLGAIGQANARVTPFGLNVLYSALMNSGEVVEPWWISKTSSTPDSDWKETGHSLKMQAFNSEAADKVADMLEGVTREGGTGAGFYMDNFAAKTGTAELADPATGELSGLYTVWASGGLRDEEEPLSITVAIDKVDSSITSETAGLIARDVLSYIADGDKTEAELKGNKDQTE